MMNDQFELTNDKWSKGHPWIFTLHVNWQDLDWEIISFSHTHQFELFFNNIGR